MRHSFAERTPRNGRLRLNGAMPYGTHRIIIGRVEDGYFAPGVSPLLYQNGAYVSASLLAA
jgi:flavin reductase (DIM6/NTAB) family NADH-FMN oxidoreductase RutF